MKRMLILIGRDFSTRVKTSSFIITTILGVIVFVGLTFVPTIMELINTKMSSSTTHLAVVDKTDFAYSILADVTSQISPDKSFVSVERFYVTDEKQEADMLRVALSKGKDGLLVIESAEQVPSLKFTYYSKNATSITQNSLLQDLVNRVKVAKMSIDMGLEPSQIAELMSSASLRIVQIQTGEQGESVTGEELDSEQHFLKMALAYFLLFMIYMSLAMYGNMVATGVAEEKSNRIMEIMISTVFYNELIQPPTNVQNQLHVTIITVSIFLL
jgi:ABC-2 type transport system permease protein